MKIRTKERPSTKDCTPTRMLSAPKDGPTVPSSTKFIGAANAPALKSRANSEAALGLSKPVILNWFARAD